MTYMAFRASISSWTQCNKVVTVVVKVVSLVETQRYGSCEASTASVTAAPEAAISLLSFAYRVGRLHDARSPPSLCLGFTV